MPQPPGADAAPLRQRPPPRAGPSRAAPGLRSAREAGGRAAAPGPAPARPRAARPRRQQEAPGGAEPSAVCLRGAAGSRRPRERDGVHPSGAGTKGSAGPRGRGCGAGRASPSRSGVKQTRARGWIWRRVSLQKLIATSCEARKWNVAVSKARLPAEPGPLRCQHPVRSRPGTERAAPAAAGEPPHRRTQRGAGLR